MLSSEHTRTVTLATYRALVAATPRRLSAARVQNLATSDQGSAAPLGRTDPQPNRVEAQSNQQRRSGDDLAEGAA
jgi:hypothetical protein